MARKKSAVPIGHKKCDNCGEIKPATTEYFWAYAGNIGGLRHQCAECTSQKRAKRKGNKEREAVKRRIEKKIVSIRLILSTPKRCPDCGQVYPRTTEHFHRSQSEVDGLKSICKGCTKKRSEDYRSVPRNQEKIRTYKRRWSRINKEKTKRYKDEYLDRMAALPNDLTVDQWVAAQEYFNNRCAVCERQFNTLFGERKLAMDHWIPLSSDECPGTTVTNIVPLCHGVDGCNSRKSSKMPEVWLEDQFGKRKAKQILERIHAYFEWAKDNNR